MALVFENEPWRHGHFGPIFIGKVVLSSHHALVRVKLCGAIVELALKLKMTQGYWSCGHYVTLFIFMLTITQS